MPLEISPAAMAAARSSVIGAGDEYQSMAEYPDVTFTEAPAAQAALDDLGVAWSDRLKRDDDMVNVIAGAFLLVGQALTEVDSELSAYLNDVGYNVDP